MVTENTLFNFSTKQEHIFVVTTATICVFLFLSFFNFVSIVCELIFAESLFT